MTDVPNATSTGNAPTGLSGAEAARRLAEFGPNDVPEQKAHPLVDFGRKFWGPSAWMIELIVLVSMFLHKWTDFWVGLGLLAINAILSWVQERRAIAAVSALRKQLQVTARVLRDQYGGRSLRANWCRKTSFACAQAISRRRTRR